MSNWSHGHSLGTGVLGGLLLASHVWTVAVLAFALGLLCGSFASLFRRIGEAVRVWGRGRIQDPAPASELPPDFELDYRSRHPW